MAKDLIKAYFKAKDSLYYALQEDYEFFFEGEILDYTNWYWRQAVDSCGLDYYLGYSKYDYEMDDPPYGVDNVNAQVCFEKYELFYVGNNGESYVMVFSKDKEIKE